MKPASLPATLLLCAAAVLIGCGGSPSCVPGASLGVYPVTATVDSTAKSPGNQQQFLASSGTISLQGSCPIPALSVIIPVTWSNPDQIHIAISSANDSTNGLATCKGPTAGPVTLTATPSSKTVPATAAVQLTCH